MFEFSRVYYARFDLDRAFLLGLDNAPYLSIAVEDRPNGMVSHQITCNSEGLNVLKTVIDRLLEEREVRKVAKKAEIQWTNERTGKWSGSYLRAGAGDRRELDEESFIKETE